MTLRRAAPRPVARAPRLRRAARVVLTLCWLATMVASLLWAARLARDPLFAPLAERGAAEIVATTDRMMAREATAERVIARIEARLAEAPRNWVVLDALTDLAAERALSLPDELSRRLTALRATDMAAERSLGACLACFWDTAQCSLANVLLCKAPEVLTPAGDLAGLARAGIAGATGGEVDELDLGLSLIGLGATAAAIGTGGSAILIKLGAGTARVARGMGLLSPRLLLSARSALRAGPPALAMAEDLGRIARATDAPTALHLLRAIDGPGDARRLARASDALEARTAGRMEMLGKGRLLRATMRLSRAGMEMAAALFALAATIGSFLGGLAQSFFLRRLRRLAR